MRLRRGSTVRRCCRGARRPRPVGLVAPLFPLFTPTLTTVANLNALRKGNRNYWSPSMKRTLIAAAGLALFAACGVASAASWSIVVDPGVYGRVAIGGYAQAPMVYEDDPVVVGDDGEVIDVDDDQAAQYQEPVYLWVPEYQRLHWDDYCDQYGARGVPVYFVQDGWYRDNVMGRRWTPEQRSWSRDQWIEQDRIARDRWEHARRDREQGSRAPDYRQSSQWQGSRGAQWTPQASWQSQGRGDPRRGGSQQQPQWDDRGHAPQPQWHDDPGHASQQWNGTPVRNEADRGHGDWQGHADGNQNHGGNPQPVGAWQPGSTSHGQPVYGSAQPTQPGRGGHQPTQPVQSAQPNPGAQQPGQWGRGGTRPVQPGVGSNQPAPAVWSRQPSVPVRPVQTTYNPGQDAGRNGGGNVPHDGGNRAGPQDHGDARAQGNERGAYQSHPGGNQNR